LHHTLGSQLQEDDNEAESHIIYFYHILYIKPVAMFSSYFQCLLIFGFVKLAFAPVLVEIEFALSVSIAYLMILHAFEVAEAFELFF
jgi:hypothetical protein